MLLPEARYGSGCGTGIYTLVHSFKVYNDKYRTQLLIDAYRQLVGTGSSFIMVNYFERQVYKKKFSYEDLVDLVQFIMRLFMFPFAGTMVYKVMGLLISYLRKQGYFSISAADLVADHFSVFCGSSGEDVIYDRNLMYDLIFLLEVRAKHYEWKYSSFDVSEEQIAEYVYEPVLACENEEFILDRVDGYEDIDNDKRNNVLKLLHRKVDKFETNILYVNTLTDLAYRSGFFEEGKAHALLDEFYGFDSLLFYDPKIRKGDKEITGVFI
jgi:hypothetical protein